MIKTRTVKFLMEEDEYQKLIYISKSKGFLTISAYLRYISMIRTIEVEDMIAKIYQEVIKNK